MDRDRTLSNTQVWPSDWVLDWTQTLKLSGWKSVKAPLFSIHIKKVTVWTNSAACRPLTASVWYIRRLSIGQEAYGRGGEKKGGRGVEKRRNTFLPTHGKTELQSAANTCFHWELTAVHLWAEWAARTASTSHALDALANRGAAGGDWWTDRLTTNPETVDFDS